MNRFPLILHIVLATLSIGIAAGMDAEHVRPLYSFPAIGAAVGLGVTAFVRFLGWLDSHA